MNRAAPATTSAPLRPLTLLEQRAVDLSRQGVPEYAITLQTRLSADQIAVALACHGEWERLHAESAQRDASLATRKKLPSQRPGPDLRPLTSLAEEAVPEVLPVPVAGDVPVVDRATGLEVELPDDEVYGTGDADWDELLPDTPGEGLDPAGPEPAGDDQDEPVAEEERLYLEETTPEPEPDAAIETLLTRAEASPQPRARQLAAEVRGHLATLEQLLGQDEKVRVLTAAAEVLRRQLAMTEAELAQLLGAGSVPEAEPARAEPTPVAPPTERDRLPYSTAVREWALANGWDVKPFGRLPGAVVTAYQTAHGGTS